MFLKASILTVPK